MSMGRRGDAYDNAVAESFFATLETELLDRTSSATRNQARSAVFDYIEGFYNPHRRHSAIGYHSPVPTTKGAHNHPVDNKSRSVQKSGATPHFRAGSISFSSGRIRFSRRNRHSSSRSPVVRPSRSPSSLSAWFTQLRMV